MKASAVCSTETARPRFRSSSASHFSLLHCALRETLEKVHERFGEVRKPSSQDHFVVMSTTCSSLPLAEGRAFPESRPWGSSESPLAQVTGLVLLRLFVLNQQPLERLRCRRPPNRLDGFGRLAQAVIVLEPAWHVQVAYKAPWDEISGNAPQFPEWPPA